MKKGIFKYVCGALFAATLILSSPINARADDPSSTTPTTPEPEWTTAIADDNSNIFFSTRLLKRDYLVAQEDSVKQYISTVSGRNIDWNSVSIESIVGQNKKKDGSDIVNRNNQGIASYKITLSDGTTLTMPAAEMGSPYNLSTLYYLMATNSITKSGDRVDASAFVININSAYSGASDKPELLTEGFVFWSDVKKKTSSIFYRTQGYIFTDGQIGANNFMEPTVKASYADGNSAQEWGRIKPEW